MTQAIITPEARDASASEYAASWGIDPSVHATKDAAAGDDATDQADGGPADTRSEYERAFDDLEDAKDDADDAGVDTDDGDDDSDVDENAGAKAGDKADDKGAAK